MCVSVSVNLELVCVPFLLVEKGKLVQLQVNLEEVECVCLCL